MYKNQLVNKFRESRSLLENEDDRKKRKLLEQEMAYYHLRLLSGRHHGNDNGVTHPIRVWIRDTYTVEEKRSDGDFHQFEVRTFDDQLIGTIFPESYEDQFDIMDELLRGSDVNGWKNGKGETIIIPE